ncbi:MAG: Calx-beta domain-containing protein, partial [Pseudomonadales bacterium]|nr:Calx-beta domain-containing protein [Pseudomonadales bacterium]
ARPDARLRVVNTGFDIGANEVLGAMLDISPRNSGVFVMTPLSTLAARMLSFNENLKKDTAEKAVADALGVNLASAPNASLFGYDPIAELVQRTGADSTGAQSVYTANLQLMALGNVAGVSASYVGQKALSEIETAIQKVLDDNALDASAELKFTDLTELTAEGHSGYMDGLAEHLTLYKPATDAFRLNPGSLTLIDYVKGEQANVHKIYPQVSNGQLLGSLQGGKLDLTNLYDLVGTDKSGRAPVLKFSLNSIPMAGSTGTAVITTRIFDGNDATREDGERVISAEATVDWESDGINVTVTAPAQESIVTLISSNGVGIQRAFRNETPDMLRFTAAGVNKPASMEMKITSYISRNIAKLGIDLATFFSEGDYYLDVAFSGIDFRDSEDANFASVGAGFSLQTTPGVFIYADDVIVSEGSGAAQITVALSQPAASDVEVDYKTIANTANAEDYSNATGTLVIKAGESEGVVSVALVDDSEGEAAETFAVELFNPKNAILARDTVAIRVIDNEPIIDNQQGIADAYAKSLLHIERNLIAQLITKLVTDTVAIGGINKSYANVLSQYDNEANLESWVAPYIRSKREGSVRALKSFTRSIKAQVANLRAGEPTANSLAVGLTKLMTGVRYVDFARVQGGALVKDDGSLPEGETEESLGAAV